MRRARLLVPLLALALVPSAPAATTGVVISQIFGGGGNAGAPFSHDYVELFNRGTSAVDVTGWTVQYATATGSAWQASPLAGTIQPGGYYLVQLAGGTTGAALPAADASGSTNMSAGSGKVALVRGSAELACGATQGSCASAELLEDLVGYGAAVEFEGSGAAPALSSATAAVRAGGGCTDTDSNDADFAAAGPTPRNSASAANACGASEPPPQGPHASATAAVDVEVDPALALSLERSTLSFGRTTAGGTPAAVSQRVTVVSNHAAGYALTVERSTFAPADLPLALRATAPAGGVLGAALAGGTLVPIPISPSALAVGTTSAATPLEGEAWATQVGFAGPIPNVPAGRYTATLTFTVIGR